MVKKRDVVISTTLKKRYANVIDLQAYRAARERASLSGASASDRAVREMLAWLPSLDALEATGDSLARMLRVTGHDGSTYFAIASNTEGQVSSFFGAESTDGSPKSISGLEWFIVGRFQPGEPPAVVRQSELELIAAASPSKGGSVRVSQLSAMEPLVLQDSLIE